MRAAIEPRPPVPSRDLRADLADLYASRYGEYVGLARLVTGRAALAEDIVQDAFAAVCRRDGPLDHPEQLDAYVARAVVNRSRTVARRTRPADDLDELTLPGSPSAEHEAALAADRAAVVRALATLPQRQRECAVCHFQFGLSHADTAAVLGIPPNTVKTHIRRARQALIVHLEDT